MRMEEGGVGLVDCEVELTQCVRYHHDAILVLHS